MIAQRIRACRGLNRHQASFFLTGCDKVIRGYGAIKDGFRWTFAVHDEWKELTWDKILLFSQILRAYELSNMLVEYADGWSEVDYDDCKPNTAPVSHRPSIRVDGNLIAVFQGVSRTLFCARRLSSTAFYTFLCGCTKDCFSRNPNQPLYGLAPHEDVCLFACQEYRNAN